MTHDFIYRPATPGDALCLSVLATQVFLDTYATSGINTDLAREASRVYSLAAFERRLRDPNVEITVAQHGEWLVGFMDLAFDTVCPVPAINGIEVLRLYVQAPFQGCGIGRRLMAMAERKAQERVAAHVWLTAWVGNARALKVYPALGYRDVGATQYVIERKAYENRVFAKSMAAERT